MILVSGSSALIRRLASRPPTRHADVHEDDIGPPIAREAHGLLAIDGLADHLNLGLPFQQALHMLPKPGVIVGDEEGQGMSEYLHVRSPPSIAAPTRRPEGSTVVCKLIHIVLAGTPCGK